MNMWGYQNELKWKVTWGIPWCPKQFLKTLLHKYKRRSVGKLISRFNQPSPPCLSGNKLGLETDPVWTSPFVNVQTVKLKIVTTFCFLGVSKKTVSHWRHLGQNWDFLSRFQKKNNLKAGITCITCIYLCDIYYLYICFLTVVWYV